MIIINFFNTIYNLDRVNITEDYIENNPVGGWELMIYYLPLLFSKRKLNYKVFHFGYLWNNYYLLNTLIFQYTEISQNFSKFFTDNVENIINFLNNFNNDIIINIFTLSHHDIDAFTPILEYLYNKENSINIYSQQGFFKNNCNSNPKMYNNLKYFDYFFCISEASFFNLKKINYSIIDKTFLTRNGFYSLKENKDIKVINKNQLYFPSVNERGYDFTKSIIEKINKKYNKKYYIYSFDYLYNKNALGKKDLYKKIKENFCSIYLPSKNEVETSAISIMENYYNKRPLILLPISGMNQYISEYNKKTVLNTSKYLNLSIDIFDLIIPNEYWSDISNIFNSDLLVNDIFKILEYLEDENNYQEHCNNLGKLSDFFTLESLCDEWDNFFNFILGNGIINQEAYKQELLFKKIFNIKINSYNYLKPKY